MIFHFQSFTKVLHQQLSNRRKIARINPLGIFEANIDRFSGLITRLLELARDEDLGLGGQPGTTTLSFSQNYLLNELPSTLRRRFNMSRNSRGVS